ncbi:MAG: hypothetical protein ABFC67_12600 [Mizugakiibacter sp.]|uniref:hypothetical protein n=1 Tax=Mizugakiibacter sp. TaxID=1972610 RepID=UPI0031C2F2B5|nr:hypothetical protein [Xanthomonadaceae bacterium]
MSPRGWLRRRRERVGLRRALRERRAAQARLAVERGRIDDVLARGAALYRRHPLPALAAAGALGVALGRYGHGAALAARGLRSAVALAYGVARAWL